MLEIILFIFIVVLISFAKAYKKTGSFNGAIQHLKNKDKSTKKDVQEDYSTLEEDDDYEDEENEDINVTTVIRDLTKNETQYVSFNIRFLSSLFITGSLINLSLNLDREIYIQMLDITIYAWYISLFFLLLATLTFLKSSNKKNNGKILKLEGTAEKFTTSNIVHMGEYSITLPKNWRVKDGDKVSIEGYESYAGSVIALNMGYNSIDGSNIKKRGKWVMLSIFLFFNLFLSGLVYEGGWSLNKLLAVYSISSESIVEDSYESLLTKSFTKGQYIQVKNIDSIIVNDMVQSYRVLLPDNNGIELDLAQIYYRLQKLKELQGTLMFNTLKYYYMDEMNFSFSKEFHKSDFLLFLEDDNFLDALNQWNGYLNNELWVDIPQAETDLDTFIENQVDVIKNQLSSTITEAIYTNNYIKFYPSTTDDSFEMDKEQLYIEYFDEPFKPDYKLDGYSYIKEIEEQLKISEMISINFFFTGYIDAEQSTHIEIDIVETDRDLLLIYYRAGIFLFSLLLYLLVVGVSIRIKKLNNKSRNF
ncbi:MAG: hypothetical protein OCD02_10325 [Spirochaetaceae bacterium]